MSKTLLACVFALSIGMAWAQQTPSTDAQLIESAMSAAPKAVGAEATIVAMNADGSMRTLRPGSNGFTCMPDDPGSPGPDPMCLDANAMEWLHAWMGKTEPPETVGLVFMLVTGSDASNTDPHATQPAAGRAWIDTGPHLMIVGGKGVRGMAGYPRTADPDPTKPYMMWIGSPYEHLMIPVR
ncbi:MAG: hypothetical protein AAGC69_19255 [Paracraurococcus sp.]|jgi:hypothetical protein